MYPSCCLALTFQSRHPTTLQSNAASLQTAIWAQQGSCTLLPLLELKFTVALLSPTSPYFPGGQTMVFNPPLSSPSQGHKGCERTSLTDQFFHPGQGSGLQCPPLLFRAWPLLLHGRSPASSFTATLISKGTALPGTGKPTLLGHFDHFMLSVTPAHSHPHLSRPQNHQANTHPSVPRALLTSLIPAPWPQLHIELHQEVQIPLPGFQEARRALICRIPSWSSMAQFSCVWPHMSQYCTESAFWPCLQEPLRAKLGARAGTLVLKGGNGTSQGRGGGAQHRLQQRQSFIDTLVWWLTGQMELGLWQGQDNGEASKAPGMQT